MGQVRQAEAKLAALQVEQSEWQILCRAMDDMTPNIVMEAEESTYTYTSTPAVVAASDEQPVGVTVCGVPALVMVTAAIVHSDVAVPAAAVATVGAEPSRGTTYTYIFPAAVGVIDSDSVLMVKAVTDGWVVMALVT